MGFVTVRPRLCLTQSPPPVVRVGDMSYDNTKSQVPAAGDSSWWMPLAAVGLIGVIVLFVVYGHKSGWT